MKIKDKKIINIAIFSLIIIVGIILDQLSKVFMSSLLQYDNGVSDTINVFGNWLTFHFVINTGSSFGLFRGANILFFIVTIIGVPSLIVWLICFSKNITMLGKIGLSMAISGALGNSIDRAFLGDGFYNGGVRDFISVQGFAIFNVADSLLCVGVGLLILSMLFFDSDALFKRKNAEK